VFGNCNKFNVKISLDETVLCLYRIASNVVRKPILHLSCSGYILGDEVDSMEQPLAESSIFLVPNPIINIVYLHPDVKYSNTDIISSCIYKLVLKKQSNSINRTNSISNAIDIFRANGISIHGLNEINVDNIRNLQSVTVTIPEEEYSRYITIINNPDDSEICGICHDNYNNLSTVHQLECGHNFHDICISTELLTSSVQCPMCSYDVRGPV